MPVAAAAEVEHIVACARRGGQRVRFLRYGPAPRRADTLGAPPLPELGRRVGGAGCVCVGGGDEYHPAMQALIKGVYDNDLSAGLGLRVEGLGLRVRARQARPQQQLMAGGSGT